MALFPSALSRCAPYPLHEWALRVLIEAMAGERKSRLPRTWISASGRTAMAEGSAVLPDPALGARGTGT